ncbi:MAG: hypothetical protein U0132_19850 [Gemmatimonadaceae bacterium]
MGEDLEVRPQDIDFHTRWPQIVVAAFTVRNNGTVLSKPTVGLVRSAPLGAFVPWQPLDPLTIPALRPGESVVLEDAYHAPRPQRLRGVANISPDQFLSALGLDAGDQPHRPPGVLPPDPLALLGRGSNHWAGSLNLLFPNRDVERHMAPALRMYPGRVNVTLFAVGSHETDQYKFRLTGDGADWGACLFEPRTFGKMIAAFRKDDAVAEGTWCRLSGGVLCLSVVPPEDAVIGRVNVHVLQESTEREALVEFFLDKSAAWMGCYWCEPL